MHSVVEEISVLVSVIVPVYNVEDYLSECVKSIINQTYKQLEIVLIDDGSRDNSGSICDDFAAIDERVVVLHKPNGGLSDARNYGLRHSHGEWVAFVDSDDWISPVFVEALLSAAIGLDSDLAIITGWESFTASKRCQLEGTLESLPNPILEKPIRAQQEMLYQRRENGAPAFFCRRHVLGDDPFPVGLYYEDLATTYRLLYRVNRVAVIVSTKLYAYRIRPTSIIRQDYSSIKAESAFIVANQLAKDIKSWYPQLVDAASSRCFSLCRMVFAQVPTGKLSTEATRRDRDALWRVLEANRSVVLRDQCARKRERLAAAIALTGAGPFSLFCTVCRRIGMMQ